MGVTVVEQMEAAVVVGRLQKYVAIQEVILSRLVEEAQQTRVRWQMGHGSGSMAEVDN